MGRVWSLGSDVQERETVGRLDFSRGAGWNGLNGGVIVDIDGVCWHNNDIRDDYSFKLI